ncbi:hypothetical protein D3C78_1473840 [compost metagenome]
MQFGTDGLGTAHVNQAAIQRAGEFTTCRGAQGRDQRLFLPHRLGNRQRLLELGDAILTTLEFRGAQQLDLSLDALHARIDL